MEEGEGIVQCYEVTTSVTRAVLHLLFPHPERVKTYAAQGTRRPKDCAVGVFARDGVCDSGLGSTRGCMCVRIIP